jgi:hypothetical protein
VDQSAQKAPESADAGYEVGKPRPVERPTAAATAAPAAAPRLYALFLTHGMGQQIPFQTIDQVASSLRAMDGSPGPKPVVRTIRSGETRLTRLELRLKPEKPVEVHLYEGYWAPLTEGRASARSVIEFLAGAGLNGLRHSKRDLRRWLFDKYARTPIPVRHVFFLLIALATVASLVLMNSAIALIAAARALLGTTPSWLSTSLFADLTTTFNLVVVAMGLFGSVLALASLMRRSPKLRWLRTPMGVITALLFALVLFVVVAAGVGIPFLFYGHVRALTGGGQVWYQLLDAARVDRFNELFDSLALRAAIVIALALAAWWTLSIARGLRRDLTAWMAARPRGNEQPVDIEDEKTWVPAREKADLGATVVATVVFMVTLGGIVWLGAFFLGLFDAQRSEDSEFARHVSVWCWCSSSATSRFTSCRTSSMLSTT